MAPSDPRDQPGALARGQLGAHRLEPLPGCGTPGKCVSTLSLSFLTWKIKNTRSALEVGPELRAFLGKSVTEKLVLQMQIEMARKVLGTALGQGQRRPRPPVHCTSQVTRPSRCHFSPPSNPASPPLTMRKPRPEKTGSISRARQGGHRPGYGNSPLCPGRVSGCCCPPGSAGPQLTTSPQGGEDCKGAQSHTEREGAGCHFAFLRTGLGPQALAHPSAWAATVLCVLG